MEPAMAKMLPDGRRLHCHHGPIDLIIEVFGAGRQQAYDLAVARFETVLEELVAELPMLRAGASPSTPFEGPVARRMQRAVQPFLPRFVTPMAAVAGAVADEVLGAITTANGVDKAYVNNGGDVAFFLAPGQQIDAAIAASDGGTITISSGDPFRGVATSGWRGRSHSLGIADAVSAVAEHAAAADVAATLIANAIDLPGHPAIRRAPAEDLSPDSDLGAQLVTTDVGPLAEDEIRLALDRGAALASAFHEEGLIGAAALMLAGEVRVVGARNFQLQQSGALIDA